MTINLKNLSELSHKLKYFNNSKLLIVTKNQEISDIIHLIKMGYKYFGENKVQEAKIKYLDITQQYKIKLDLIGPLQTNKVKTALEIFDTIQTIDREKLVDEITKQKKNLNTIRTKNFYLQINIGEEDQKSGVKLNELNNLYNYSINSGLNIIGLMCIPPNNKTASDYFKKMAEIRYTLNTNLKLSMGMSGDYIDGLKNGSNIIRVGSLIFNE